MGGYGDYYDGGPLVDGYMARTCSTHTSSLSQCMGGVLGPNKCDIYVNGNLRAGTCSFESYTMPGVNNPPVGHICACIED